MPCGGIFPREGTFAGPVEDTDDCFHCGKTGNATHYCEEWDCYLHKDCIGEFLLTEEGQIVIKHGHSIIIEWEEEKDANG